MSGLIETLCGADAATLAHPERGLLRVTGADRVRFLNGMLTCDVDALAPGQACAGLQLDRKGHIQTALWAVALPDVIWLDIDPGGEALLAEWLGKHVIADDVEIERCGDAWSSLSIEGPGARAAARELGAPDLDDGAAAWGPDEVLWLAGGAFDSAGVRALATEARIADLDARAQLPALDADAAHVLRVEVARPQLGVDTRERTFPQEAGLETAVSFTKGCYIGQEIVARIHSRGAVNRRLVQLSSDAPVDAGSSVEIDERRSGEVTSAAVSPLRGPLALAYVRADDAEPGTPVRVGSVRGVIVEPTSNL